MGNETGTAVSTNDIITAAKMSAKLETAYRHAMAFAKLDLSGSAQADVPIFHAPRACTIVKVILVYTEASSGDAGITVEIGKETDANYYFTGTSEINKAKWYELDVTLLQTALGAGDTVICGHAGGKAGTGEILVFIEYTVDD